MSDVQTYTLVAYGDDAYVYPVGSDQAETVYAVATVAATDPVMFRRVTAEKMASVIEQCSPDVTFHFMDGATPPKDALLDNVG